MGSMDFHHLTSLVGGVFLGWYLRGCLITKEEPIPCNCLCSCHHQLSSAENSNWTPQFSFVAAGATVLVVVAANLALAFKVTWISRGDEKELAFVVSHTKGQGKSKGVFNSPKGLQIKG